jgi:hypothetical protein
VYDVWQMSVDSEIERHIADLAEPKRSEVQTLIALANQVFPNAKRWYLDGRDETGKVVANPSIGFGNYTIRYADGSSRDFYQVGISANKSGISVYVMGLPDKTFLPTQFGATIGKATVTGYCIKFRSVRDVDLEVIKMAMQAAISAQSTP